jgi:RNA polymerase sigma-70 factor (ECF subfamily)
LQELTESPDERRLVERAKKDPREFSALYELHFARVYAFIARRVSTREDAEDVTSLVFHRALQNIGGFEWRGAPFAAWLFRIASNALADRWKRASRSQERGLPSEVDDSVPADVEEQLHLAELLSGLPVEQRRVVVGRFLDGSSIRELAAELGRSEGAVKQLQFRAMQSLRAQMQTGTSD